MKIDQSFEAFPSAAESKPEEQSHRHWLLRATRLAFGHRRGGPGDGGQAMVEFALVLPPLLLILTGLFSLGIVINQYEILTNAVSEGARAFALSRGQAIPAIAGSDKCAYAIQTLEAAAPTLDTSSLSFTITYTPVGGTATPYTNTCSGIVLHPTDTVQVSATYSVAPLIFGWGGRILHINATTSAMVQ